MSKILHSIFYFYLTLSSIYAQQSINSSGGDGSSSAGSISYSIGQIVYQAIEGSGTRMIEGVQQPYEILIITGLNNQLANLLNIKVYPNPTFDHVTLSVDDLSKGSLYYRLYDMHGRIIQNSEIIQTQTLLNLNNLPAATYLLKVMSGRRDIRTFKIFKT